jgi:hypothetical protein
MIAEVLKGPADIRKALQRDKGNLDRLYVDPSRAR